MLTENLTLLDVKAGRVVKGVNFVNLQDAGDPVGRQGTTIPLGLMVFLDIGNSRRPGLSLDVVYRTAERCLFL